LSKQEEKYDANNISKKGFSVGLEHLWNRNAREIATKYLNAESEIVRNNLIDFNWLTVHLNNLRENTKLNPRYINKMFSLLALEIWHRLFITHSIKSSEKL
jgi:hypothetical protein